MDKKLLGKLALFQTVITLVGGLLFWVFNVGRAEAEYVKKTDLVQMQTDIQQVREDVAFIKGRLKGDK